MQTPRPPRISRSPQPQPLTHLLAQPLLRLHTQPLIPIDLLPQKRLRVVPEQQRAVAIFRNVRAARMPDAPVHDHYTACFCGERLEQFFRGRRDISAAGPRVRPGNEQRGAVLEVHVVQAPYHVHCLGLDPRRGDHERLVRVEAHGLGARAGDVRGEVGDEEVVAQDFADHFHGGGVLDQIAE
jgi:hypothetical protein